jgi:hypothetical protein
MYGWLWRSPCFGLKWIVTLNICSLVSRSAPALCMVLLMFISIWHLSVTKYSLMLLVKSFRQLLVLWLSNVFVGHAFRSSLLALTGVFLLYPHVCVHIWCLNLGFCSLTDKGRIEFHYVIWFLRFCFRMDRYSMFYDLCYLLIHLCYIIESESRLSFIW